METMFSKLHDEISKEVSQGGLVKKHTVKKKDFYTAVEAITQRLQTFIGGMESLSDEEKRRLVDKIYGQKTKSASQGCAAYINMAAETRSQTDSKFAFASYLTVSRSISDVLANFLTNVDAIFEGAPDITIHDAKMTHLTMFGFVDKADLYSNYVTTLFNVIAYEVIQNNGTHELKAPAPYKYSMINASYEKVKNFHLNMLAQGRDVYLNTFKSLMRSTDNIRVANADTGSNISMIEDSRLQSYSRGLLGQFSLNPFRWLGEQWNLLRDNYYKKKEAERDQIMTIVSLLQMDLNNMDKNSDAYQKNVKVIDAYNAMLAKLDQKINSYYNS